MKDIAVGAAVFEHLNNRSAVLKELMATSVITANQSVKLCVPDGVTQVETAYLCGIFRNLGELVVAGQPIGALFADAVRAPVLYPEQAARQIGIAS